MTTTFDTPMNTAFPSHIPGADKLNAYFNLVNAAFSQDTTENNKRIGSRRRQRINNDSFKDHPLALLTPEDLMPPGYGPDMPKFHFIPSYMHPTFYASIPLGSEHQGPEPVVPRSVKKMAKRAKLSPDFVQECEDQLNQFIKIALDAKGVGEFNHVEWEDLVDEHNDCFIKDNMEDEDLIIITKESSIHDVTAPFPPTIVLGQDGKRQLAWTITDSFSRLVIHTMCKYYNMFSFSLNNLSNERVTYVVEPDDKFQQPLTSFYSQLFS